VPARQALIHEISRLRPAGRIVYSWRVCFAVQHVAGNRRKIRKFGMGRMDVGSKPPLSQTPPAVRESDSVIAQLKTLLRALIGSRRRRRLGLLGLGVLVVICANAAGQIWLNRWQGDFYEAIEQRHMAGFITQLMVFAVIAGGLLVLVVSQTWLRAMIDVRLREWLTHDLLDQWLVRKRAYLLSFAGEIGINPDQRIQQDAQHLTDLTTILAIGLLQSTLLLMSFTGVLWVLSSQVVFDLGNGPVTIPGYMVWCAFAYSLGGSLLAWRVGRPLVPLNAERYAREADLRVALVRINERADGIVLHGGEADERRLLNEPVDNVVTMMTRLAGGLARLTWITSGYGWLALVVPIIVAAPGYFDGDLSFGTLMVVVGAFNQVQSSLRWFVDNLPQIADWRATLLRVVAFRDALAAVDTIGADTGRIEVVDSPPDKLELDHLEVALPEACAMLDQSQVEMSSGERIQILGDAASGKSTLFRALAGMWPWGGGTIRLPPREAMMFMPQRPYMPLGTLRAAVCYPAEPGHFHEPAVVAALERVDLGHLVPSLDRTDSWDRQLPLDEQQRLAFARLLLHAPHWVVLDDAISALGDSHRRHVLSFCDRELVGVALIRIGREPVLDGFWNQTLHIIERSGGPRLRADPPPGAQAAVASPTGSSQSSSGAADRGG
jgi:vitamin B12/bleomycin/antimicrobial peptide transport system ATP-binding/permease protein